MVLPIGATYVPRNSQEIRDDLLTDMRLAALAEGIDDYPVTPGSDNYIRAEAYSQMALLQYANISIAESSQSALDATGAQLDRIREALALPVIPASPSSGKVIIEVSSGTGTIADGTPMVLPNGKNAHVVGTHSAVGNGAEISVLTDDTGADTELAPPNALRFVSVPFANLATEARVSPNAPLTGGADEESDSQKRARILLRMGNPPAGGNWSHKVLEALQALITVQAAFVYPAVGGPASERVVVVKDIDPANGDFSRALSATATAIVRNHLHSKFGSPMEIVVSSAANEPVDASITVTIPDSTIAGGNGKGWRDAAPWPQLDGADNGRVSITTVHGDNDLTIAANTATAPVANVTHIAWWSENDYAFHTALVTAVSGSAGAWRVTLDKPLADSTAQGPTAGEFISPDAVNIKAYGTTWRTVMRRLGPGVATEQAARLPRANRHPDPTQKIVANDGRVIQEGWEPSLTIVQLEAMKRAHPEISDTAWSYRSLTTASTPANVSVAPNILIPAAFAIYPT